jgi:hypothetical protein
MTKGMPITPLQLMSIKPGAELDEAVSEELGQFVVTNVGAWSTDPVAALKLMDLIQEYVSDIGIMRLTNGPDMISHFATIGEEGEATIVFTSSWMESLSKAFILYQYGHTGEHFHPKWERKKRSAPKRILQ